MKIISRFFNRKPAPSASGLSAETEENAALLHQSEKAGLQLTIQELKRVLANQDSLLAESERSRQIMVAETVDAKLQILLGNLASPLA